MKNQYINPFKAGDRIKLVRKESCIYEFSTRYLEIDGLKVGQEYTVHKIDRHGNSKDIRGDVFLQVVESTIKYHHPYDCFESVLKEVPIYTNYTIYATTNKQAEEIVAYQKKLFGNNNPAGFRYEYWINRDINKFGFDGSKGWFKKQEKSYYNQAKSLTFAQWKEMIEYEEYLNKTNMKDKGIIGYKLLKDLPNQKAGIIFKKGVATDKDFYGSEESKWEISEEEVKDIAWFEAVYEDEEKIEMVELWYAEDGFGELETEVFNVKVSSKGYMEIADVTDEIGSRFEYKDLKKVLTTLNALEGSKWRLKVSYITIGCKENVCVGNLEYLMQTYEKLNNIK